MKLPDENIRKLISTLKRPSEIDKFTQNIQELIASAQFPAALDSNLSAIYKLQQSQINLPQINIPAFDLPKPPDFSQLYKAIDASKQIYNITLPFITLDAATKAQIELIANPLGDVSKTITASFTALDMSKHLLPLEDIFKRFRELYEDDEETAEAFSISQWTIAPSMPKSLKKKVLLFHKNGKSRHISNVIMGHYFRGKYSNLKNVIEEWREHPLFVKRMRIIDDAFEAHVNKKYTLSIPALLPLVEGILNEYVQHHNLSAKCGKIKEVYETVLGNPSDYSIVTWSLVETLLQQLRNNTYAYTNFETQLKKADSQRAFSRHTVLHGIKTNYYQPSNSLRVFLLLDAISALHDDIDGLHNASISLYSQHNSYEGPTCQ